MSVRNRGHPGLYFSVFVVDNEHTNQGRPCSSIPMYILVIHVVHNIALYRLGGSQDDFTCSLSTPSVMMHNAMLSV